MLCTVARLLVLRVGRNALGVELWFQWINRVKLKVYWETLTRIADLPLCRSPALIFAVINRAFEYRSRNNFFSARLRCRALIDLGGL